MLVSPLHRYAAGITTIESSGALSMPPTLGGDTLHDLGAGAATDQDREQAGEDEATVIAFGRTPCTAPSRMAVGTQAIRDSACT